MPGQSPPWSPTTRVSEAPDGIGQDLPGSNERFRGGNERFERSGMGFQRPRPGFRVVRPGFGSSRPGFRGVRPGFGHCHPGFLGVRPGFGHSRPGSPAVRPGFERSRPGFLGVRPGFGRSRPGSPAVRLGFERSRPGFRGDGPGLRRSRRGLRRDHAVFNGPHCSTLVWFFCVSVRTIQGRKGLPTPPEAMGGAFLRLASGGHEAVGQAAQAEKDAPAGVVQAVLSSASGGNVKDPITNRRARMAPWFP